MNANRLILFFIVLFLPFHAISQHKSKLQLEKEKEENMKKIKETNKILLETRSKKQATLGQLSALNQQIAARQALISSISAEVALLEDDIMELSSIINALEKDLNSLKKEYAAMIYAASKSSGYYNKLTFIFSAESFNQMAMRMKYFKQYSQARQKQAEQIEKVKASLGKQKSKLAGKIARKTSLLAQKTIETENLNEVKNQQSNLVKALTQKEKDLKKELEDRKNALQKLNKLIIDLITAERERAEREAREAAAKANANNTANVPSEGMVLSSSFAGNMAKLPWPVAKGNVSHKFGKHPHPVLKGVYVENLGIDIQTLKNEPVRSVFEGKVITVAQVPGMNNVIMIQHGEFFTVYAKLKTVFVKTGQMVKAKEIIGEVYTDKDNNTELQFQVWKNSVKLDPEKWLYVK